MTSDGLDALWALADEMASHPEEDIGDLSIMGKIYADKLRAIIRAEEERAKMQEYRCAHCSQTYPLTGQGWADCMNHQQNCKAETVTPAEEASAIIAGTEAARAEAQRLILPEAVDKQEYCDCGRHIDDEGNQIHYPPCPLYKAEAKAEEERAATWKCTRCHEETDWALCRECSDTKAENTVHVRMAEAQRLTLPEAVEIAKGIREKAETRRREVDEAEAKAEAGPTIVEMAMLSSPSMPQCVMCNDTGEITVYETGGTAIGTAPCPHLKESPTPVSDGLRETLANELEEWESNGGGNFPIEADRILSIVASPSAPEGPK